MKVVSTATIQRLGTTDPLTHFFRQADGEVGEVRVFNAQGSAAGIGDVVVRVKHSLRKRETSGLAAGVDLRIPTGDALNLLGSGTPGVQPFAIWSGSYRQVSPHINVGYRWNGSSVLAGNPSTGESGNFPDDLGYALGADVSANSRLTIAFDVLGRYTINAERLQQEEFHALDGRSTFPSIGFAVDSYTNALSGSMGMKAMLADKLLLTGTSLFSLDDRGVRDRDTAAGTRVQLLEPTMHSKTVNDGHCHFLSNRFFEALGQEKVQGTRPVSASDVATELAMEAPGPAESLADRWIAELDRHHVSRAALIGSIPGDEESVAAAVRRHPARLVGFFALNAAAPDAADRARRAFGELSLRCACLFPAMHRYGLTTSDAGARSQMHTGAVSRTAAFCR